MMIYELFSKYVIEAFLTDDKKGEYVSLVVDEQFMEDAAQRLNTTISDIIKNIRENWFCNYRYYNYTTISIDAVISVVAIQLYAASKMEADKGERYTEKAYYVHLDEILQIQEGIQKVSSYKWMINNKDFQDRSNQDQLWKRFYEWCDNQSFSIKQLYTKSGPGRYTQYPLDLAKYTFNREDLKYIASVFEQYKLQLNEEIDYSDFWKIFNIKTAFSHLNNHTKKIFETIANTTNDYDIAKSQIYNHFISWDGEYKDPYLDKIRRVAQGVAFDLHLSTKNNQYKVVVKDESGIKRDELVIGNDFSKWISRYYRYKRDGIIIFLKNKVYPNYCDETRYIEDKEEVGIAVVTNDIYRYKFRDATNLFFDRGVAIYEFEYSNLKEYYSADESIYKLVGGLRVGRRTYLVGGEPILQVDEDITYKKDGKVETITKGLHLLEFSEGEHRIRFPKSPYLIIKIVAPTCENRVWLESFSKWSVSVKDNKWQPNDVSNGIVGLDFEYYFHSQSSQPILKSWTEVQSGKRIKTENNISLKILNNLNKYE